ncbi:MAG: hypothetical protein V3R14_05685 [Nitrospinaceae bacterium]
MSPSAHPILAELSNQLPQSAHTFQRIQEAAEFEAIATQAQRDISCLENLEGCLEDGRPAKAVLEQSGYQEWLEGSDSDERLRVLGALTLIADLSEDLAED